MTTVRLIDYIAKPYFIAQASLMLGVGLIFIGAVGAQAQAPPQVTQPRYATVDEERAWEARQLGQAMDELAAQPTAAP